MKLHTLLPAIVGILSVVMLGAVPSTINYQGVLTDADGNPFVGSNDIIVQLFTSDTPSEGETSLFSQSFAGVQSDSNGIYSIQIGDSNGTLQVILESYEDLWLELTINSNTLSPRHKVNAVPYALHAESANRLINAESSNISGSLYVESNLDVSGNATVGNVAVSGLDVSGATTLGSVSASGTADFGSASRVTVPEPITDSEAATKQYVDNARTAAIIAATTGDISASNINADIVEVQYGVYASILSASDSLYVAGDSAATIINGNSNMIYGDTTFDGSVSINSGILIGVNSLQDSDYRFKDNIKTITGAVDKVKQLRGVEYTLKSNGKDSVGVIAQEVEEVYPQLVHTSDERLGVTDAKAVNYSSLIGVLIEAVKEQQSQIEALKTQVNELQEDNINTENASTNLVVLGAND